MTWNAFVTMNESTLPYQQLCEAALTSYGVDEKDPHVSDLRDFKQFKKVIWLQS